MSAEAQIDEHGWYNAAKKRPAHRNRVGKPIKPRAVVVHTTDMHLQTYGGLLNAWGSNPGKGNAAHFVIGRTPEQGITQLVSCAANSNHAGGSLCGAFLPPTSKPVHPNAYSIGIEIHNPGELRSTADGFVQPRATLALQLDRITEPVRLKPGSNVWWLPPTQYQLDTLSTLLRAIAVWPGFAACPSVTELRIDGTEAPKSWARVIDPVCLGHATINPSRKTDPGPILMDWVREHGARLLRTK